MMKKILRGLLPLAVVIGVVSAFMTSNYAHACDDCKVKGKEYSERVCGSCKKKGMSKTSAKFKNGYWYVNYKCDHCNHTTVYKTRNIREI